MFLLFCGCGQSAHAGRLWRLVLRPPCSTRCAATCRGRPPSCAPSAMPSPISPSTVFSSSARPIPTVPCTFLLCSPLFSSWFLLLLLLLLRLPGPQGRCQSHPDLVPYINSKSQRNTRSAAAAHHRSPTHFPPPPLPVLLISHNAPSRSSASARRRRPGRAVGGAAGRHCAAGEHAAGAPRRRERRRPGRNGPASTRQRRSRLLKHLHLVVITSGYTSAQRDSRRRCITADHGT